jgi:transposase
LARLLLDQIAGLTEKVAGLDAERRRRVTTDDTARRLTMIPGVGPIGAAAITTFAPPMETFSKGRDFAARVGLTPRHHSSGGKERLGRTSKMGRRDIRGLLIIGAVAAVRRAACKRRLGGLMARADAGAQTKDAGRGAAGQPRGPNRLGAAAQGRGLRRSGDGGRIGRDR